MGRSADAKIGYGVVVPENVESVLYEVGYDGPYELLDAAEQALFESFGSPDRYKFREHKDWINRRDFDGSFDEWKSHEDHIRYLFAEEDEEGAKALHFHKAWKEDLNIELAWSGSYEDNLNCLVAGETLICADWCGVTEFKEFPPAPAPAPADLITRVQKLFELVDLDIPEFEEPTWLVTVSWG